MLSFLPLAGGCATTTSSYCDIAKPIWWNDLQEMEATPAGITRQVVQHNEQWAALCKGVN